MAVGAVGGTILTLLHVNPIRLLVISAVVNGIVALPFLLLLMLIAGNPRIMGEHRNGRLAGTLGWATVAIMGLAVAQILLGAIIG